jgi:hypothetical protein
MLIRIKEIQPRYIGDHFRCKNHPSKLFHPELSNIDCFRGAGTVKLTYWPTTGNETYPVCPFPHAQNHSPLLIQGIYLTLIVHILHPTLSYTFTSPSVYMIVETIWGWNDKCKSSAALGPTFTSQILGFDLTDVNTFYSDPAITERWQVRPLTLNDLAINCANATAGDPEATTIDPCNPRLQIPIALKRLGYPYWAHCGNVDNRFGLFDPPGAIPALDGDFVPVVSTTETSTPGSGGGPTPQPQVTPTTTQPTPTSTPSVPDPTPTPKSSVSSGDPGTPGISSTGNGGVEGVPTPTAKNDPSSTVSIISKLPNGSVTTVLATIPPSNDNNGNTNTNNNNNNPDQGAANTMLIPIATVNGQIISANPGASVIVIPNGSGGQTLSIGGAVATVGSAVVSFGSDGLVVQLPGGVVRTVSVPAAATGSEAAGETGGAGGGKGVGSENGGNGSTSTNESGTAPGPSGPVVLTSNAASWNSASMAGMLAVVGWVVLLL